MRQQLPMPVLPKLAQKILSDVTETPSGCLISARTPSRDRPWVRLPDKRLSTAYRVVMAVKIDRELTAQEDVHHSCRIPRCVNPEHLELLTMAEHKEHHAAELRQTECSVHQVPYTRFNAKGWGVCSICAKQASARWRERNPDKANPSLTDEQKARQRLASEKHRKANLEKYAEKARKRRARIAAEKANKTSTSD